MTVLVVSNVATTRARRQAPELQRRLGTRGEVCHHETRHPAELEELVRRHRWRAEDWLVINGGDGSVQHALSLLLATSPPAAWPRIACLPGGSTNMTAFDLNAHRRFDQCLTSLELALAGGPAAATERPLVAVSSGAGEPVRCGLFFGVGTIVQGIEYFQARVKGEGAGHELGAGLALARTLWGIARHQPPFSEPLAARVSAPQLGFEGDTRVDLRLLFATTLKRLFLGIRPYWGEGEGALRVTAVERRAPALLRCMPRLLRGRPDGRMTPQRGYHSHPSDRLQLRFNGSYTLDGELFGSGDGTLDVTPTDAVRFVVL